MKIGRISIIWPLKRVSSPDDHWNLDPYPRGEREDWYFKNKPEFLSADSSIEQHLQNVNMAGDIREKRRFANFSYRVATPWVCLLFFVTMLQGFHLWSFSLGKSEFITVVTSTTGSVLGFCYIVGQYLFRDPHKKQKEAKESPQDKTIAEIKSLLEKLGKKSEGDAD